MIFLETPECILILTSKRIFNEAKVQSYVTNVCHIGIGITLFFTVQNSKGSCNAGISFNNVMIKQYFEELSTNLIN